MPVIKPTIGRVVLFVPSQDTYQFGYCFLKGREHTALVCAVHGDRMVNVSVFDVNGKQVPMTSVKLVQPGDAVPEGENYCKWMDYQVGQAQKTEQLEKELAAKA